MLYLLDKDVKTVKWNGIPLHEASSAIVKEETNGDFYITVRYPITDSGIYQLIKEDMLIKAPTPVLGPQLFRIKKPVENDDSLDITAYHITDDVMQRSITPVSVVGQGCAMALSQMVQNAKTGLGAFSFTSDIMDSRTFNTTETETLYSVLMDGKHSIVGTWEGELVRDNFALTIKRSRGADRGVVITTHKNLKSYQRTKNSQSVVTRIHAKSTFKAEGADEETTITVTVDSPLISNYPYINEKDYENNNAKTVDELRKWAEAKFKNEGIDKISDAIEIEAYELDGQVIHLGDTVNIKSRKHDVDLYKKAIAYEYNALTEKYISITFDDKPGVGGSGVSSGVSNAADVILGVNANAQEIAVERAIRNANQAFDAEFEKRVEEINDGIEQSRAEAERHADQIKTEISQEFDAFEQEYQVTKQSQSQQIADILAKAQANTILATDAKNIGNQAKADAANALSKAIQYKNEAIAEATRLDTVERQATETKLATAKSQAISEATRLVETAKSLLSGQISNISTDLSQTKEAIKLLATKATVDTLTGRVSSAEAMIQVQADQISQRVKTSDFDQAEQRISTAESSITQLGNRITTEISETVAKIPTEIGTNNLFILSGSTKGIYKSNLHQDVKSLRYAYGPKILIDSQATYTLQSWSNILNDFSWLGYSQLDSNGVQIPNTYVTIYPARLQKYYRRDIITHNSAKYIQFSFSDDVFGDTPNLKIKLEKGMIASDWSPAPEDAVAEIENVKTAITQTTYGQEQLSTKLTETQGKVTIAETNIRQLVNVVSSKVSQETFDNLKRTVDSQGTSISQNQSAIALKAEKTYVDGVKTTADSALSKANANADSIRTAKAELKVTSDAVATKVSQSDFNAVDQRLTSAETTIRTQAGLIEQRLTSTQVESLVVGKGYATSTVVQNLVKETSDAFKKSISETKKLIPTNFDNTNLLSVSNLKNGWFDNEGILRLTTMYVSTDYIELDSNTSYIWQTWTKSSNWAGLVLFDSQKQYITGSYRSVTVDSYVKQTIESGNAKYIVFSFDKSILDGAIKSKLEKGAIATEWVPAYQDLVSTTEFHEVADTVDSHKRTISEQGQSISQVIQTANGLVTKVSALDKSDNLFSFEKSTKGFWIDRNGSAIAGKTYSHSDFLKLASDGTYQLQVWNKSTDKKWIGYTKYTSDKSYISGSYSSFEIESNGYKLLSFTNFDGYLIISYGSYTTDNMTGLEIQFERGLVATAYKLSTLDFATQTQVNTLAGSWSVQNLNSSGDILSQANLSSAEFLLEAAKIRLKGKTLADEIQAIDGKFKTLFVADGTFAKLNANVIDSQTITADKLKVDQAFFTKLMANDAYLKQLFTKSVFTTQVQAVTLSASKISGGILTATNKAMEVNLNAGQILYYTDQAALKRVLNGYPTQFVKFATGTVTGKGNAGVTVIGSNRWNTESSNDGGFVGIRAWNGANIDSLDLVGDDIRLASSAFDSPDGWDVRTLDSGLRIAPHNRAAERNSRIEVGDVWIMKGNGTYSSLRDILNAFNGNFSKGPNADSYTYYPNGF
ncbi:phage tail spike protein [Streptococcus suis]|uniref:Extracellular matrix-binding protein ebhB n=1 Tax=Streptococcus suis TaxID=1307 RepID=A0A0Z8JE91_STRSU|nr:phage tail spike protein [Streptococcus suis]CYV52300.1 Extracellular matrix-binding protein ebhB [Streptococcus suis]